WSPDGRWLVFAAKRGSDSATLWKMDFGKKGVGTDDARLWEIADRAKPLATSGIVPTRVIWAADSQALLFQNKIAADRNLYRLPIRNGVPEVIAAQRGVPIRVAQ